MRKKCTSLLLIVLLAFCLMAPVASAASGTVNVTVIGDGSVNISVGDLNQSFGTGSATTAAYNYDETQPSYTITVSATPAANNTLASLNIDGTDYYSTSASVTLSSATAFVSVKATFNQNITTYGVTLTQPEGGGITASTSAAEAGDTVRLTATPNTGYGFKQWTGSGVGFVDAASASTTFTMPSSSVTISAEFEKLYELTFDVKGEGGSVSAKSGSYAQGAAVSLSLKEFDGYAFVEWTSSNGGSFSDKTDPNAIFTMPAGDTTVTAVFEEIAALRVLTTQAGEGGSIIVNQKSIKAGTQITVRAAAQDGYHFVQWSATNGGEFADPTAATTTFTMPDADTTIVAEFAVGDEQGGESSGGFRWWIVLIIVLALLVIAGVVLFILERQNKINLFGRNKKNKNNKRGPKNTGGRGGDEPDGEAPNSGGDTTESLTGEFRFDSTDIPIQNGDTQDFFFYRKDD